MFRIRTLLFFAAAFALPTAALAKPISTYYFEITDTGGTGVAIFQIGTSDPTIPAGTFGTSPDELDYNIGWAVDLLTTTSDDGTLPFLLGTYESQPVAVFFPSILLTFPDNDFSTFYTGGGSTTAFTLGIYNIDLNGTDPFKLIVADTPFSLTPEPSSLALLATGLLGFGGIVRRRVLQA